MTKGCGWRRYCVLVSCFAGLVLPGCASFWDDVTSRDFKFKSLFQPAPDPLVVLRESKDGDHRAKAIRRLQEPKLSGGTDQDQNMVVELLTSTATKDKQALCRLAAIQTLSRFKDPRAVEALKDAYFLADSFPPEIANVISCQALTALGETRNPAAVELLARVAQEPRVVGSEQEKQQALDVRIAAVRALSRFDHYRATEALVTVLRKEKDIALRDRAHEALQAATGMKLPPEAKAWENLLHRPADAKTLAADGPKGNVNLSSFTPSPQQTSEPAGTPAPEASPRIAP